MKLAAKLAILVGTLISLAAPAHAQIAVLDNRSSNPNPVDTAVFNACNRIRCITVGPLSSGPTFGTGESLHTSRFSLTLKVDRPTFLSVDWQGHVDCGSDGLILTDEYGWRYWHTLYLYLSIPTQPNGAQFGAVTFSRNERGSSAGERLSSSMPVRTTRLFKVAKSGVYTYQLSGYHTVHYGQNAGCVITGGDVIVRLLKPGTLTGTLPQF